jgi:hypothetical protein
MEEIASIWSAVQDTPVPNLLIVSGLIFLFLAVVGKVGAKLIVTEQRQRFSAVIGSVLLLSGLALSYFGGPSPQEDITAKVDKSEGGEKVTKASTDTVALDTVSTSSETANQTDTTHDDDLLAESTEAWLTGDYATALQLFGRLKDAPVDAGSKDLAGRRYAWLAPFQGRVLFADDFENDSVTSGSRWISFHGAPDTGRGGIRRTRTATDFVLQLDDHYHAQPRISGADSVSAYEVRIRFRVLSAPPVGGHINLMMDEHAGRTTVGLYATSNEINVWETKGGREIGNKGTSASLSGWQELRIAVDPQWVRVYLQDELVIDYRTPRARPVSLVGFNLETLSGSMQFDNLLVTAP